MSNNNGPPSPKGWAGQAGRHPEFHPKEGKHEPREQLDPESLIHGSDRRLCSCVRRLRTITRSEEAQYAKLLNEQVISEPIQHKSKWAAGMLDFLIPGIGHYYLGEWGTGTGLFLSNIFWPFSPFWVTPAGVVASDNVNKRYTIEYYTLGECKEIVAQKEADKCFNSARNYIDVQQENGKYSFTKAEMIQYLLLQNCTHDIVNNFMWDELQKQTNSEYEKNMLKTTSADSDNPFKMRD